MRNAKSLLKQYSHQYILLSYYYHSFNFPDTDELVAIYYMVSNKCGANLFGNLTLG